MSGRYRRLSPDVGVLMPGGVCSDLLLRIAVAATEGVELSIQGDDGDIALLDAAALGVLADVYDASQGTGGVPVHFSGPAPEVDTSKPFLETGEAARLLGVSRTTVLRLFVERGILGSMRPGGEAGHRRLSTAQVLALAQEIKHGPA